MAHSAARDPVSNRTGREGLISKHTCHSHSAPTYRPTNNHTLHPYTMIYTMAFIATKPEALYILNSNIHFHPQILGSHYFIYQLYGFDLSM